MTSEKAEHVTGIVLQPLWKTQKIDWTVRKNVFKKNTGNYGSSMVDDRSPKGRHPFSFRNDTLKETTYTFQKEQTDRNKDKQSNPLRYRPPYHRKRWITDTPCKPPTPQ